MIQTGFKVNGVGNFVKDYISIIILVPAFIGGIWQLLELMSISMPYVRFFSISQIVPDGILILIFLSLISASVMFPLFLDSILPKKESRENNVRAFSEEEIEQKRKKGIRNWFLSFLIFYILGSAYFIYFFQFIDSEQSLYFDALVAIIVCLFCNLCLTGCYNLASINKKEDFKFFNFLLLILYMILGYHFCHRIHNTFLLINNLDNFEKVQDTLKEIYPNSKNEILYFNDKYLFIDVTDTLKLDDKTKMPKEKIHILPLETLFND